MLIRASDLLQKSSPVFSETSVDTVCRIAVWYLALPVVLFFVFWFTLPMAVVTVGLLGYLLQPSLKKSAGMARPGPVSRVGPAIAVGVFAALLAVAYTAVSMPALNSVSIGDAIKHGTLMADLVREDWPVTYFSSHGGFLMLRYSFAYYLVPAGIAKLAGQQWATHILLLWTAGGVFLFFLMAAGAARSVLSGGLSILAAALFAGLGPLFALATGAADSQPGMFVFDAWARSWGNHWLVGSHPFELRWSAQHGLAAWLVAGVLYHAGRREWFGRMFGVLAVCLLLWSPFVACAFVLLQTLVWLASASRSDWLRTQFRRGLSIRNGVSVLLAGCILVFLSADVADIPVYFFHMKNSPALFLWQYVQFAMLEFGLLFLALRYAAGPLPKLASAALLVLLCLLFTAVGSFNDLQMRASQLPFTLLMFFMLAAVREAKTVLARGVLAGLVTAGAIGGILELRRPGLDANVARDQGKFDTSMLSAFASFGDGEKDIRRQYVARVGNTSVFPELLRHTVQAPSTINFGDLHFAAFGIASFDLHQRRVASAGFTDAGLVSDEAYLPAGLYRLDGVLDWDIAAEAGALHAAHLSLHGDRILLAFNTSHETDKRVSVVFRSNGEPFRIAFGLGGWAKGKGSVSLKQLTIVPAK
jgi:hypothetical protein